MHVYSCAFITSLQSFMSRVREGGSFFFFFPDENFLIYSSEKTVKEDILHLGQIGLAMALGRVKLHLTQKNVLSCKYLVCPNEMTKLS